MPRFGGAVGRRFLRLNRGPVWDPNGVKAVNNFLRFVSNQCVFSAPSGRCCISKQLGRFHAFIVLEVTKMASKETVCVTGASGFIGSWIVKLLLERGYDVRGTVQDLGNEKETKHLEAMDGAKERLKLCQMDLLNYNSVEAAIDGSVGVFHLASPCIVEEVKDPEAQLLDPAIKGTKNVLQASHKAKVKRVVVTSSISSVMPSPNWPADVPKDENCWTDLEYCKQHGVWYPASKTLAEKETWEFAKETGLNVVVINPGTVLGPILPPAINASMGMFLTLLKGCTDSYQDFYMGCVHVRDVAEGHIILYENSSATGRHLCVEATAHWSDFADAVARLYPEFKIHKFTEVTQPGLLRVGGTSKKLIDLGLKITPMEDVIKDSVNSLKERGFLN